MKSILNEKDILQKLIDYLDSNPKIAAQYQAEIGEFKSQLERAKLDRYKLGVIGVTSSGKSTMINAIMRKKLLSTAVRPSSSQLVTCTKSPVDQLKVFFEDKPPVVKSGSSMIKEIAKYSDERYNPGNKLGVKQLMLSTTGFLFPEEILLIDSPGLDAHGYEGHEKLTLSQLLPDIDFCIYVTTTKTNSDEKMKTILDQIARYDYPLIIVQNMLDSVKGSLDGKKTPAQVAAEHKIRIEKIIQASSIRNKKSVRIIQISAIQALNSFTAPGLTQQQRKALYQKSNFQELVQTVNEFFNAIRPRIESNRLIRVKENIQRIIDESQKTISLSQFERQKLVFEHEGKDEEIQRIAQNTQKKLESAIHGIKEKRDYYSGLTKQFTKNDITNTKDLIRSTEDELMEITNQFRTTLEPYCKAFNQDIKRLGSMSFFGQAGDIKIMTKQHTVTGRKEKDGFGGKVARFFGKVFKQSDWGYTQVTTIEYVYDHEETKKRITAYYDSRIGQMINYCAVWEKSAEKIVNALISTYDNRKEAFEERKRNIADQEQTKKVIEKLKSLMCQIPDVPEIQAANQSNTETLHNELITVRLDKGSYSMIKLAVKMQMKIHQRIFKSFIRDMNKELIIIGWDSDCVTRFVNRNLPYPYAHFSEGAVQIGQMKVMVKPTLSDMSKIKAWGSSGRNICVIFNATQFGSGLNDIDRIHMNDYITEYDLLYFVAQDFEEIINGNGVRESIQNLCSIKGQYPIKVGYKIMVNHPNPVFNLAVTECQTRPSMTTADELAVLQKIQSQFPYLTDPDISKQISEIFAGFSNNSADESDSPNRTTNWNGLNVTNTSSSPLSTCGDYPESVESIRPIDESKPKQPLSNTAATNTNGKEADSVSDLMSRPVSAIGKGFGNNTGDSSRKITERVSTSTTDNTRITLHGTTPGIIGVDFMEMMQDNAYYKRAERFFTVEKLKNQRSGRWDGERYYALGCCYYFGHTCKQDYEQAVQYFRTAAEDYHHAGAQCMLGICYYNGYGIGTRYIGAHKEERMNQAKNYLKEAAYQKHRIALNLLKVYFKP